MDNDRPTSAGRRRIDIELIEDSSRRRTTFSKRKRGLLKKSRELSALTGAQLLCVVVSESGRMHTFATPQLAPIVESYEGRSLICACLSPQKLTEICNEDGSVVTRDKAMASLQIPVANPLPPTDNAAITLKVSPGFLVRYTPRPRDVLPQAIPLPPSPQQSLPSLSTPLPIVSQLRFDAKEFEETMKWLEMGLVGPPLRADEQVLL